MAVSRSPRVCVVAPTPILTLTIESGAQDQDTELHVHPGGQGLWVARMAYSLGADVVLCGPFGGETGTVLAHLAEKENLRVRSVGTAGSNGAYLHDRRRGERDELAFMPPSRLDRHEIDDLYGTALVEALDADVCVITGAYPARVLPGSFFGRLIGDLHAAGITTVADLSGDAAREAVKAGVDVLKMSHTELVEAELAADDSMAELREGALRLIHPPGDARGVGAVMVSRAADPALLVTAAHVREVIAPSVTTVDHRGAGDSMTAGIAVAVGRGLGIAEAARLGAAAGALNVTRRGLGTGHREQIERFAEQIDVREVEEPGADSGDE